MVKLKDGAVITDLMIKNILEIGKPIQYDRAVQFSVAFKLGERMQTGTYRYENRNLAIEDRNKILLRIEELSISSPSWIDTVQ